MRALGLVVTLVFLAHFVGKAQIQGPEQDCFGALPVCDPIFSQPNTYVNLGTLDEIADNTTCMVNGETNSVWYIFTVDGNGVLEFTINPLNNSDDYDFMLFDLTGASCSDIESGSLANIRCNWAVTQGVSTGLQTGFTGVNAGPNGDTLLAPVNVTNGQVFAIMIDNFSGGGSTDGYTIDFTPSTVSVIDNTPALMDSVFDFGCDRSGFITFSLSEPVRCNTIAADGSDFTITGPQAVTVIGAIGEDCNNGAVFASRITIQVANPILVKGTYQLNVQSGTDGNSLFDLCDNETVPSFITFDALENTIANFNDPTIQSSCFADTAFFVNSSENLAGINSITWDFGDGSPTSNLNDPVHIFPDTNSYTVELIVGTADGCADTFSTAVAVPNSFIADFDILNANPCPGDVIQFNDVSSGVANLWQWSFGDASFDNVQNPTHAYADSGTYTVQLIISETGPAGTCSDTAETTIFVTSAVDPIFTVDEICTGQPAVFTDQSNGMPTSWHWDFGNGDTSNLQNPEITYTTTAGSSVDVTLTVSNACNTDSTTQSIIISQSPIFDIGGDTAVCFGESLLLTTIDGADTYQWSTGETTSSIEFSDIPNEVRVRVETGECFSEDVMFVSELKEGCFGAFAPTAFSPNNDGLNDLFRIIPLRMETLEIFIYNRWGEEVFYSNDLNFVWEGRTSGDEFLPIGVYNWYIQGRSLSGDPVFERGNVTLVR